MKVMDYQWTKEPKGQFVDGHKHEDIVLYWQTVFLPIMEGYEAVLWTYALDGLEVPHNGPCPELPQTVLWSFYANNCCKICWVHKGKKAIPQAKEEGASFMVADFMSPDYGWMKSPDGKEAAQVTFKAGKAWDGYYYTSGDILKQAEMAMDILDKHFSSECHVPIFDNGTMHTKWADDALSACKMPKNTPKDEKNWGVETPLLDALGKQVFDPSGKAVKQKVMMANGCFKDGSIQEFYLCVFKGMATLLVEHEFLDAPKLLAQCKEFKCTKGPTGWTDCCCCHILYNQPDFTHVDSLLESVCKAHGYSVVFLLKFHCELNFIKQCWGYTKQIYHMCPVSSKEVDLEWNVLASLDAVPLDSMHWLVPHL